MPYRVSDVTVVVPAHNEQDLLESCLTSLGRAALAVPHVEVQVVLVLDSCTDRSRSIAQRLTRVPLPGLRLQTVVVAARNVGIARAAGLLAAPRFPGSWYASTDADSSVPPHWLAAQLESAVDHEVFVGTVEVRDWAGRTPGLAEAYRPLYSAETGHRHVHATNLGMRADAYWRAGGFPALLAHEDEALIEVCEAAGMRIDWSAAAPVVTSARRSERTPDGFSAYLSALEAHAGLTDPAAELPA